MTTAAVASDAELSIQRIFGDKEFSTKGYGPTRWLDDGESYTTVEELESDDEAEESPGQEIIRYNTKTGKRTVLISATQLTPEGAEKALKIDNYEWSEDKSKLLIFTNTVKVWRDNTRGDYWLLDLKKNTLRQIAPEAEESTLMFAKLNTSADAVGYVRENNIYVESVATGETIAITTDGATKLINGTFDWAYEEELGLQDGFRFSPDGKQIAYWQLDSSAIRDFYMINNTDTTYPELIPLPYPKVGTENSSCRIGVVSAEGGETRWMKVPGDPKNNYLASMEWVADSQHLLIEQLNRLQNERTLYSANSSSGEAKVTFVDKDDAWVDLRQKFDWYRSDTHRLLLSEKDGWRHIYRVSRADQSVEQLPRGDYDVIHLVGAEQTKSEGWLYFTASPSSAIHGYLYRVPLGGGDEPERLTPEESDGQHSYNVAPNGRWAIHRYSAMGKPPVIEFVSLPEHKTIRVLQDNADVVAKLDALELGSHEFIRVPIKTDEGPLTVDGWMIKPPNFDSKKKYPIIFYVYTEPAGQTSRDSWGGDRYLWHQMLAQQGYLIVTTDNRGTPAPRGRAWRKAIYGKIGIVNVADQAAAALEVLKWPFVDETRVGVWGWSGGGSMTLNAMFQHPEIYQVGVSVAPVGNQLLYDTIYQERYMGLPETNAEGFKLGSPVTHAKNLKGKLLLIHGTGDDNVHYQNAEVVINELIKNNRPFDMMSYPNRAHGIRKGENTRVHLYELMTRYFLSHL
jgi:dipeptidyl-peptidase-4